jgi:serine/threonine-protein kinase
MTSRTETNRASPERVIGRYAIYDELASGGMAVVHLGRLLGQAGFSRTVAIKRLHPQFAKDRNFVAMFLDEARLSVRVQHPNVVAPLDVLIADGEVLVVMEYVAGDTLARLQRSSGNQQHPPSPGVIVSILSNALHGLHAAHEALGEDGTPLRIVHRDISPQNIMVGTNGIARVLDFGVAKAAIRSQCTTNGEVKGKLAYMAPEQIEGTALDCRTDIFAAGVVAWESLTRRRLFTSDQASETISRILSGRVPSIRKYAPETPPKLDEAVQKALRKHPKERYATAREFATALESACAPASPSQVADWVAAVGGDELQARAERVAAIETKSSSSIIRPLQPPPRVSETLPIVPPPPGTHDSKLMQSQSRITVPLVQTEDIPFVNDPTSVVNLPLPSVGGPSASAHEPMTHGAATGPAAATGQHGDNAAHSGIRRRWLFVAAATLVLVITCGLLAWRGLPRAATQATEKPVENNAPATLAAPAMEVAKPPLPVNEPAPSAPATAVPHTPTASESASVASDVTRTTSTAREPKARPSRAAAAAATPTRSRSRVAPTKSAETTKGKANCNPPYVVDASGIRRLRPECL